MQRDMAFAVHGISELSFAGAAAALLLGINVVAGSIVGSLIAAALIGVLGAKARDRNSIIGVLMPFGLGLGILFLGPLPGAQRQQVRPAHRADHQCRPSSARAAHRDQHRRAHLAAHRLAAAHVRQPRPRGRERSRGTEPSPQLRVHDSSRSHGGRVGADHRGAARARAARDTCRLPRCASQRHRCWCRFSAWSSASSRRSAESCSHSVAPCRSARTSRRSRSRSMSCAGSWGRVAVR